MSNTLGTLFKITTFGESHSNALGVVIDGCPSNIHITKKYIESYIKKNSPFFEFSTKRREENKIEILSGIYKSKTLGTPIAIITKNFDIDSSNYLKYEGILRPSHADYAYFKKYGIYDPRGGGRASGREGITRHIAASIADKVLKKISKVKITGKIIELAGIEIKNKINFQDAINKILQIQNDGDSTGGVFEITIKNLEAGIGMPIFEKLSSKISSAIFSIGGIKALEIGKGFALSKMTGSQANDLILYDDNKNILFLKNNSGGITGGISNGAPVIIRAYVKPTPSILKSQDTINFYKKINTKLKLNGRFDANFTPRAMALAISTLKIIILDLLLINNAYKF